MLLLQQELYKQGEKHLSAYDMMKLLKPLKNDGEHAWLYDVSNSTLKIICQDLANAYDTFFKKKHGLPKLKSRKKSKPNFPVRECIYFKDRVVMIEKVGKVKYKTDFDLPKGKGFKFINPRVSYVLGKWMLTFSMECENQALELTDKSMGIDLGIKELAVVALVDEHLVFHNINKSKKIRMLQNKLKHMQRSVSRKYEVSKLRTGMYGKTANILKDEDKVRKIYKRISNIRSNYIHQTTHGLISLLPKRVVMEDLNIVGMMKNRHLSKAIAEQNFSEFIRQMKYKCEWNGIEFIQVGRFYPSSKTCSNCGNIKQDLKLKDRVFKCECGLEIDRDFNAALNLSRYEV